MNLRTLGARCVSLCALLLVVMAGWPLASTAQNTYALPMVLPASNAALAGFVRIINLSARAGTVSITAVDSDGESYGPVTLSLDAHEAVNFNSRDLEQGNAAKGLPSGVGDGSGSWRLSLETALNVTPGVHPHVGRVRDGDARRSAGNCAGLAAVSSRVLQSRIQYATSQQPSG